MLSKIFSVLIIASVLFAILNGNISGVSNALLEEGNGAIELALYLMGGMCVWGGLMRVADKAGITDLICSMFKPLGKRLFRKINTSGKAFKAMCMNISANLLGLGNAATPFGLEAMKELEKEEGESDTASDNMIIFTVLNTASITIIPTTAAMLRLKHGSEKPMEIFPAVILNSVIAVVIAVTLAKIISAASRRRKK